MPYLGSWSRFCGATVPPGGGATRRRRHLAGPRPDLPQRGRHAAQPGQLLAPLLRGRCSVPSGAAAPNVAPTTAIGRIPVHEERPSTWPLWLVEDLLICCAPEGTRTPNLLIRSQ